MFFLARSTISKISPHKATYQQLSRSIQLNKTFKTVIMTYLPMKRIKERVYTASTVEKKSSMNNNMINIAKMSLNLIFQDCIKRSKNIKEEMVYLFLIFLIRGKRLMMFRRENLRSLSWKLGKIGLLSNNWRKF